MKVKDILIGMEHDGPGALAADYKHGPESNPNKYYIFYDKEARITYGYDTDEPNINKVSSNFFHRLGEFCKKNYTGKWKRTPGYSDFKPFVKEISKEEYYAMEKRLGSAFSPV